MNTDKNRTTRVTVRNPARGDMFIASGRPRFILFFSRAPAQATTQQSGLSLIILPPEQTLWSFSLIGVNPGSSVVFYCMDTAKNSSKLSPSFA